MTSLNPDKHYPKTWHSTKEQAVSCIYGLEELNVYGISLSLPNRAFMR